MDVGERASLLPHFDHVDRHRLVPQPTREQSFAGVTRRRLLLHGHRGFQGYVLPEILPDHADHVRSGLVLGSTVRRDTVRLQGSAGSSLGGRDGGRFLAFQRHEIAADDHATAAAKSRLGEDRADLQIH